MSLLIKERAVGMLSAVILFEAAILVTLGMMFAFDGLFGLTTSVKRNDR